MRLIHKKSTHFTELENNFSHHISHKIKCLKVVCGFMAITICNENTKPIFLYLTITMLVLNVTNCEHSRCILA